MYSVPSWGCQCPLHPPTPPAMLSHRQAYLCLLEPSLDSDISWVVWNAVLMSIWNTTCEWTPTVCNYPAQVLHHCSVRLQLQPTSSKITPGFQDGNGRALNQVGAPSESRAGATAQLATPDTSPHHQVPSSLFKRLPWKQGNPAWEPLKWELGFYITTIYPKGWPGAGHRTLWSSESLRNGCLERTTYKAFVSESVSFHQSEFLIMFK